MRNCPTEMEMARYLDQTVDETERNRLDAHLRECPDCRLLLEELMELKQTALAGLLPAVTEEEAAAAVQRLAANASVRQSAGRTLAAFFRGLINAADASALILDSPLLARDTRVLLAREGRQELVEHLCALRCEALILAEAGIAIEDADLLEEAVTEGWFVPGKGTPLAHLGKLLMRHGMEVKLYTNAGTGVLRQALEAGYQVIAAVDAGELQNNHRLARWIERVEDLVARIPDHCLVVSGLRREGEEDVVIVMDPNTPGESRIIPVAEFLEAWEDSGFYLLAARLPERQGDREQEKRT